MNITRLLARVKNLEIISTRLVDNLLSGNYRSVFRGPGLEFSEVREYVEGDDTRQIDWNVSSRSNATYTKTFREEREIVLFLLVDMSSSVFSTRGGDQIREAADLVFSLFAFAAVNNNDRVGACFFTDRIEHWVPPLKGRGHALRLIQDMLSFKPLGIGSNLALALKTTGEALKRRGICVLLSDFKATDYMRDLSALARRHDVIAVRLVPPEDLTFPHVGTIHMEDSETGQIMTAYGSSHRFRKAYRDFWLGQRKQWFREVRRRRVSPLEIRSDEDPVLKLSQFFQRRRIHR